MSTSGRAVVLGVPAFILLLVVACFAAPLDGRIFISNRELDLYSYPCLTDAPECQFIESAPSGTLYNLYGVYVAHDNMIWASVSEDMDAWLPVARNGICPVAFFGTGADDIQTTGIAIEPPIYAPPVIRPPDTPSAAS